VPKDVHQIRQFLGLASYFQKYVQNFGTIVRPITNLLQKDCAFAWGKEQQKAFNEVKEKLTTRPVLALYDPNARTEVHTDASQEGIGAILLQEQADGLLRPVMYYSQTTTKDEKYHAYELETLAVVKALRKF